MRNRPSSPIQPGYPTGTASRLRRSLCAAALACAGLAVSGCSVLMPTAADPTAQQSRTVSVEEAAVVDEVVAALEPVTGGDGHPSSEKLFSTLQDAGYDPEDLEASSDASPLGNEVPSKMFGVRTEFGCVVGEIREGSARAELLPESDSNGACLFGEVDRPDGVEAPAGEDRSADGEDNGEGHMPEEDINGEPREDEDDGSASGSQEPAEEPAEEPTEEAPGGFGGGSSLGGD
ncbi:DUF6993 domain-containing protein [Brevibacterium litoralis]|uniref:DUF6993 domain-containing protein n=1 Tax=Brevibacterium litoralis TaxID=3138935 RepID=UPI0032EC968B